MNAIRQQYNAPFSFCFGVLGGVGGRVIGTGVLWAGSRISTLSTSAAKENGSVGTKCQQRKLNVKRTVAPAMADRTLFSGTRSPLISYRGNSAKFLESTMSIHAGSSSLPLGTAS